jgi:hypothetical protein
MYSNDLKHNHVTLVDILFMLNKNSNHISPQTVETNHHDTDIENKCPGFGQAYKRGGVKLVNEVI